MRYFTMMLLCDAATFQIVISHKIFRNSGSYSQNNLDAELEKNKLKEFVRRSTDFEKRMPFLLMECVYGPVIGEVNSLVDELIDLLSPSPERDRPAQRIHVHRHAAILLLL